MIIVCDTCGEKKFRQMDEFRGHLLYEHGIDITDDWNIELSEKKGKYYCENCNVWLKSRVSLHKHLSTVHGIVTWYERHIGKKKAVYLDGLTRDSVPAKRVRRNET